MHFLNSLTFQFSFFNFQFNKLVVSLRDETNQFLRMKSLTFAWLFLALLVPIAADAQQRDRLAELIEVVFDGLFPSKPMNWRDAEGNLPKYWVQHFKKLGVPVPEGVPGTNPTDLSRSPILKKL